MFRKLIPALLILVSVVVVAVSQDNDPMGGLRQQLLSQDEIQEVLSDEWIVAGITELDPLPDGALVSTVATYEDGSGNTVIIALVNFETPENSGGYLEAFRESPIVAEVRDLKEEAEENPDLLSEFLMDETDQLILLELVNGSQQLLLRRGSLASFMRASPDSGLDTAGLLEIAEFQLQKIVDYCENVEGEPPAYC